MAGLLDRLLLNSSPSQLSVILSEYLETAERKRNAEFYSSLKSVLTALKEHVELEDEIIRRIYRDCCLPVLCKNVTERALLYSVYDILALCCTASPNGAAHEIFKWCLNGLANYCKEITFPAGLPVLACLDLVGHLLKSEAGWTINEDSREKLFYSLLDVLCISDEVMCARMSSGILPLYLTQVDGEKRSVYLQTVWFRLKEMAQEKSHSINSTDSLQKCYAAMCSLLDIFMDSSTDTGIIHDPIFWQLIQQGLKLQDPLSSKRATYLLQKSLDHVEKKRLSLEVKDKNGGCIFFWVVKEEKKLLEIWQDFILLIETLSETQVHVIKPVLTKFNKIVTATYLENNDPKALHISWLTTIIYKASVHPSRFLRKWAALEVMTMDLSKSPLLHPPNWHFLLGHFQTMLSEYSLYSKDHDGISGTLSPVGTALRTFYKKCLECLPNELHVEFMRKLIVSIEQEKLAAAPLACVFNSLSSIPSLPLLGPVSVQRIRNMLLHLRTHAVNFRLATKGFILTTIANLTNPSLVSWDVIFNFLTVGNIQECLQRGSWLWKLLCSWIWNTIKLRHEEKTVISLNHGEELEHFLMTKLHEYLKAQQVHQDCAHNEAASLGFFIIVVLDAYSSHAIDTPCDLLSEILNVLFKSFQDASTRLYMSESRLCNTVLLLTSMLQVIDRSHGNTAKEARIDLTKESVANALKCCLTDIVNLIQRKLTACDDSVELKLTYLKLTKALQQFLATSPSMNSSWQQFGYFLENITRSNIKTIQHLQGYSNHGNHQWLLMYQSILLVSWVSDISSDDRVTIPQSVSKAILDAIPTFKLNVELKSLAASTSDGSSFQDAADAVAKLRNSVSGYLGALWKTVAYHLQQNTGDSQPSKMQDVVTVSSGSEQVLEIALEALVVTSSDNVMPIMASISLLIPRVLNHHSELCSRALDVVWITLKELWNHPSFWEILYTTTTVIFSPTLLMLPEGHPLTIKIKSRLYEFLSEGEFRHGIMNVVVQHLSDVWTKEPSSHCISSLRVHKELIVEMLLYNVSTQKTHMVDTHVDAFLRRDLSFQSPLCSLQGLERRNDAQVRVMITNVLLTLDASNTTVHEVLFEIVRLLLARDDEISVANPKMYANSCSHRKKHHAWQAILVLLPLVTEHKDQGVAHSKEILRYTFTSLECANQVSVQNYQQWTILYIILKYPNMAALLWNELHMDLEKRAGRISLLATVAMLFVVHCVTDSTHRPILFRRAISALFPWISVNHRQARVHAQFALQRMWDCSVEENLELVLRDRELIEPCLEFISTNKDTLAEKVRMFENYFFFDFNPIRDFSIETIYFTIPKHSGVSEEEWIQPEEFQENELGTRLWSLQVCYGTPLYNKDRRLAEFVVEPFNYDETVDVHFKRRVHRKKLTATTNTSEPYTKNISVSGDVQKKIIAWNIVPPDEIMMAELQQQRMVSLQKSSGGNLIVVASLIDKAPNLGGLCRTSEIFGVKKLVLGSNEIMKDKNFQNLSVSSSKWIDIEQVRTVDLKEYLKKMQRQGYILIGVEQTANSKPLTEYSFPHDALLLLGNEKEGIPADLIQLLDVCVEIPQVGVIRSLNVHVSGALLIWEYTRQRVLLGKVERR